MENSIVWGKGMMYCLIYEQHTTKTIYLPTPCRNYPGLLIN